jgi:hypothetical protein
MNKTIEKLRDGTPTTRGGDIRIIRAFNSINWSFRYDDESGGIFAMDQGGFLLTKEELKELTDGLNIFFEHWGEEVEAHNKTKQEEYDNPQPQERYHYNETPKTLPRKGWVYVVHGQDDQYKIGLTTREPDKRLAEFTPKLPFKTELILTIQSDDVYALEAELHEFYASQRVNGEWFRLSQDNIAWLLRSAGGQE